MSTKSALVFCLIIFSICVRATNFVVHGITCPFQSLYQIGDSLADTGNSIRIPSVGPTLPANRLPYGETFPGRPTGRWSDGRLIIDCTAMALGLPLLNPYLDKNASFENGVNFAVAGATAMNSSFFSARGVRVPNGASLDVQLSWFKTYLNSICSTPRVCADELRRSLFFVGEIGGNDINYPLAQGKSLEEIQTYVPFITEAIINSTRMIIRAGAMRIVIPGNFPIGCFPYALELFASNSTEAFDELGCLKSLNNLATYQNNNLQAAINSLRREFPNVVILYADFYNAFRTILRQAPLLGFSGRTLLRACCGNGPFNDPLGPQFCGNPGVPVCRDPNRYIHWDGLHLTQEAYRQITKIVLPSATVGTLISIEAPFTPSLDGAPGGM